MSKVSASAGYRVFMIIWSTYTGIVMLVAIMSYYQGYTTMAVICALVAVIMVLFAIYPIKRIFRWYDEVQRQKGRRK